MKKILIVEDEPGIREAISDLMIFAGYECKTAQNGKIGLSCLDEYEPDLIVSDIMMPEMDGMEMLQQLKSDQRYHKIPIVMLTAKTDSESRINSYKYGADGYIFKPFDLEELLFLVQNLLSISDATVELERDQPVPDFVAQINNYIEENIEQVQLEEAADFFQLSISGFQKKLRRFTALSFTEYSRKYRLQKAKSLLKTQKSSVKQVAYSCGFKSLSNFSSSFKGLFGYLPSESIAQRGN